MKSVVSYPDRGSYGTPTGGLMEITNTAATAQAG